MSDETPRTHSTKTRKWLLLAATILGALLCLVAFSRIGAGATGEEPDFTALHFEVGGYYLDISPNSLGYGNQQGGVGFIITDVRFEPSISGIALATTFLAVGVITWVTYRHRRKQQQ